MRLKNRQTSGLDSRARKLYEHPDGHYLAVSPGTITVFNADNGRALSIPIGAAIVDLGYGLIEIGRECPNEL